MVLGVQVIYLFTFPAGVGCDRAFCGAYWHAQGVSRIANNPICSSNSLKAVCATVGILLLCSGARCGFFCFSRRKAYPFLIVWFSTHFLMISDSLHVEQVNERFISRIPHIAHGKNHHEQEV